MKEFLRTIAITGSSGSIGREFPKSCGKLKIRLEDSEIKMMREIKKISFFPKTLIHLAGLVSTSDCELNPKKAYEINVEGSIKLMKAAKLAGVKEFIYVSTSHVYKSISSYNAKINLSFPICPNNVYGKSKLAAEKELGKLSKKNNYPKLTIVRVFSVFSIFLRKGFLVSNLFERKKNKDYSPIPGLKIKRDFLNTKEISKKLIRIAKASNKKKIYLLCSGRSISVEDLAYKILDVDKNKIKLEEKKTQSKSSWNSLVGHPTII